MPYVINDELLNRLKEEVCICPSCKSRFTFATAAAFARFNQIKDNVVMCNKCHRVYEIALDGDRIFMAEEVTNRYPWIKTRRFLF